MIGDSEFISSSSNFHMEFVVLSFFTYSAVYPGALTSELCEDRRIVISELYYIVILYLNLLRTKSY